MNAKYLLLGFDSYWSLLDHKNLEMDELKELLYPAQAFERPVAFKFITYTMAYISIGNEMDCNPSRQYQLHVEGRVLSKPLPPNVALYQN